MLMNVKLNSTEDELNAAEKQLNELLIFYFKKLSVNMSHGFDFKNFNSQNLKLEVNFNVCGVFPSLHLNVFDAQLNREIK